MTLDPTKFEFVRQVPGPLVYQPGNPVEIRRLNMLHPDAGPAPADATYFAPVPAFMPFDPATGDPFPEGEREVTVPAALEGCVCFVESYFHDDRTLFYVQLQVRPDLRGQGIMRTFMERGLAEWTPEQVERTIWGQSASAEMEHLFSEMGAMFDYEMALVARDGQVLSHNVKAEEA